MGLAGCLADGTPDAWGRRVILRRLHAGDSRDVDTAALPTVTYLLASWHQAPTGSARTTSRAPPRPTSPNVAATERVTVLDRDVLLVNRFDRIPGTRRRRALVSALTLLSLGEMHARYATYPDLARTIRTRFSDPQATLVELYGRLAFNVLIGNRDIDAAGEFLLSQAQARAIIDRLVQTVVDEFD